MDVKLVHYKLLFSYVYTNFSHETLYPRTSI
jgi:hypothetical protein